MRLALGWLLWFQWTAALRVIVSPRAVRGSSAALLTLAVGQPLLEDPQNLPKMPSAFFGFEEGGWLEVSLSAKPFADYGAYGRSEPYTLPTWSIQPAALSGHQLVRKMLAYFGPTVSSWGRRWVSDDADGQAIEMCPNSSELMRNGVVHEVGYSSESQTGGGRGQMLLVASSDDIPKCAVVAEDRRLLADRSTEGDDAANISSAFLFLMNERQWALAHRALLSRLRVDPLHRFAWNTFLPSAVRVPLDSNVTFSYRVLEAGRYLLFVMAPDGEPYWLQGEINLTNPHGGHLSTTQYHEGEVVAVMAVAYGAVAMILFVLRFSTWKSGWNARHSLIGTVFALKSTYLVLDACNCRVYQERGTLPTMRIVVPKLVAKLEDIAALMMFFLLSLGWRVFRRRLTRLESRLAAALAVLSFYLAVFEIVMGGFQLSRYILHAFAFLCIIVAVNFNVALLSSRVTQLDLNSACSVCYSHVASYKMFRWIFVCFIMKPSALLFFKLSILHYDSNDWESWVIVLIENAFDFAIYNAMLLAFAPTTGIPLIKHVTEMQSNEDDGDSFAFEDVLPVLDDLPAA